MKINHVNLTVADAQGSRRFFERYLGLVPMEGTSDTSRFVGLRDSGGFVLSLMQPNDGTAVSYPDSFHIGFLDVGIERTRALYRRLKDDEYAVNPPGFFRENEFYFHTPWGFTVQVS